MFSFFKGQSSAPEDYPEYSQILAVSQGEFGLISADHMSRFPQISYIQTDGLSVCSGLAAYDTSTRAFGLGHFDEGINIPASIYAIRKKFDRFFLFGYNNELFEAIKREVQRRSGAALDVRGNDRIANLRLNIRTGQVKFAPRISNHPRYKMIEHEMVFPISFYEYPLGGRPVIVEVDPAYEKLEPLVNYQRNIINTARMISADPEMKKAFNEGEIINN